MQHRMEMKILPSQSYLQKDAPQTIYVMMRLIAGKIDTKHKRLPVNLSFVIDRSGSMQGEKLAYTKQAVQFALGHLEHTDTVSVVTFDDNVDVMIPAGKAINKDQMAMLIKTIRHGGTTNLSGGFLKGAGLVKEAFAVEQVNRVILLTDGLANRGITDPVELASIANKLSSNGISVSTLGVGEGFQEDLLVNMAEKGSGNFYFISSPEIIPEIFQQELEGLLSVTAQNLELTIVPAANVNVTGILGYEPQWEPEIKLNLPDMYSGDIKTILFELQVYPHEFGTMPLAQLKLKYDDVFEQLAMVDLDIIVKAEVTDNEEQINSGIDIEVIKEVEIFRTSEVKENAIKKADEGFFAEASKMLKEQSDKLNALYALTQDFELLEEIKQLNEGQQIMGSQSNYSAMGRKKMKNESYRARRKR